jgi:spore maturation protein CgeB
LKIWGDPLWEKYIEGKVQYMGVANLQDAAEIVRKSKIVLHQQPINTLMGSHERVLNAMASNAFVIADHSPQMKLNFDDNIGFYDYSDLSTLPDVVNHYLKSSNETTEKAKKASEIVAENHKWANRVRLLMKLFLGTN